jgi:hypothetical protein
MTPLRFERPLDQFPGRFRVESIFQKRDNLLFGPPNEPRHRGGSESEHGSGVALQEFIEPDELARFALSRSEQTHGGRVARQSGEMRISGTAGMFASTLARYGATVSSGLPHGSSGLALRLIDILSEIQQIMLKGLIADHPELSHLLEVLNRARQTTGSKGAVTKPKQRKLLSDQTRSKPTRQQPAR